MNGLTQGGLVISNILYQPSDQLAQIDYGNGVRTTYGYDPRLRLNSLLTISQLPSPNSQLINFTYDFDGVSNIKSISDNRPTSAVPLGDPRRNTQVFAYDDLYRITRATYNPATLNNPSATNSISYRYDRIGNMLAQNSDIVHVEKGLSVTYLGNMSYGGPSGRANRIGRAPADAPGPHALTGVSSGSRAYPYDANGNMTLIDGLTNTWDFKDRLVGVENSEMRAEYTYDYTDRRILKRVLPKTPDPIPKPPSTVSYPDKYFEVREHDAPVKYVWNGNTRVARVTGSFTTNQRVQRFRLWPGWNLVSLAVTATNALNQLRNSASLSATGGEGQGEVVLPEAYKWNAATNGWETVAANASLPANTVLWLKAATNTTAQLTGTYTDPVNHPATAGASFQPGAGLEAWSLLSSNSYLLTANLWQFDGANQAWRVHYGTNLPSQSDFLATLATGDGFMARVDNSTTLAVPESALRIRYYHQDHLTTSTVLTDSGGGIMSEIASYPFGFPRSSFSQRKIDEAYFYTQKEKDRETGLDYFEARYLFTVTAAFLTVDPQLESVPKCWLSNPRNLHSYGYCARNPLKYFDPSGRVIKVVGDAAAYNAAIRRLEGSETATAIVKQLQDSKTVYTLNVNNSGNLTFDSKKNTINWDPNSTIEIKSAKTQVKPEITLIHEMAHAQRHDAEKSSAKDIKWIPLMVKIIKNMSLEKGVQEYHKDYEEEPTTKVEQKVSAELGLKSRQNYDDHTGSLEAVKPANALPPPSEQNQLP